MAKHTSLGVGGLADLFLTVRSTSRLIESIELASALGVPWRAIGAANNLLISNDGIEGLVLRVVASSHAWRVERDGAEAVVEAEAGCILASLARGLAKEGLAGLEWAVNVPGTVGAAIVNNSGAVGSATADHLIEASLHVPKEGQRTVGPQQLGMTYRTSALKRGELRAVVLAGTFRLEAASPSILAARTQETQRSRQATQPNGQSLGSMFANPPGDAAGRLIEAAGLKGVRVGGAEVSRLHANFILNRGGARASDVLGLMQEVQHAVWQQSGHWLVPEVQLVGRWRDEDRLALESPPGAAWPGTHASGRHERFASARAAS